MAGARDSLFRRVLFWLHLTTGVCVGVVVLVMSVTGVLLAFQKQLTAWADLRGLDGRPPAGTAAARLSVDTLVARVSASPAANGAAPTAVTVRRGDDVPVEVAFGRERRLFANAYTGAVLGEGSRGMRAFFGVVTDWHRWLAMSGEGRDRGRALTGAANLGFLFIVLSGMYLWIPRTRAALRSVVAFRRGLSGKARDFNWHNVIGIWSALPLVLVVASGVVISYPWASALVYRAYGERPPVQGGASNAAARGATPSLGGLDALVTTAARIGDARMGGWRTLAFTLPAADTGRVNVTLDRGTGGEPQKRATLTLDRATGRELKWEPFARLTPARRARSVLRFTHTGEVLGIVGQTIAGLASLGTAVLVYSGLALALRRFASWSRRRERVAV